MKQRRIPISFKNSKKDNELYDFLQEKEDKSVYIKEKLYDVMIFEKANKKDKQYFWEE